MRSRAIHSNKNILRRPDHDGETEGMDKIALVFGEGPNATPPRSSVACAKFIITPFFRILGGRTFSMWRGSMHITTGARRCVYGREGHVTAIDALRSELGVRGIERWR